MCGVSEFWSTLSTVFACKYRRALISTRAREFYTRLHKVNIKPCFRRSGIRVEHRNIISLADSHPAQRWQMTPRLDYCWDFNASLIRGVAPHDWSTELRNDPPLFSCAGVDVSTLVHNERAPLGRITQGAVPLCWFKSPAIASAC